MNPINIISASAGSGKTTRTTKALSDGLTDAKVRPEAVIATTFTVKAANELAERVRTRLLADGMTAEAQRLAAARIGTVNSVCDSLVRDHAFTLGVSPDLVVLDEDVAGEVFRRSIANVLEPEDETLFTGLSERMGGEAFDWQGTIEEIVGHARSNLMTEKDLAGSMERSLEGFLHLLDAPKGEAEALRDDLQAAIESFLADVDQKGDTTKVTDGAVQRARMALSRLKNMGFLPWSEWAALAKLELGKASRAAADPLHAAAGVITRHPTLLTDCTTAIRTVFGLAGKAMAAYRESKTRMGAIDFIDQESLALELLKDPAVRSQVGERLDLLLVDEFQDTSPLQLAIFLELAGLAHKSIWVGDQKQAIYAFRGADSRLMDAAIDGILGCRQPETLSTSYRSRPDLVSLTSALFAPAFAAMGIPEERVRLTPSLAQDPAGLGSCVEHWPLPGQKKDDDILSLASTLKDFLDSGTMVRDASTGEPRAVEPGDVAVLCRANGTCAKVAAAIQAQGIRAMLPRSGLFRTPEARAVLAGLRLWADTGDTLARAELGRLLQFAGKPDEWLAEALTAAEAGNGWKMFGDAEGVKEVLAAREAQPLLGALAAFDEVMAALRIRWLCHRWGDTAQRLSNLEALRTIAAAYTGPEGVECTGRTPAGLAARMEELAAGSTDLQGAWADRRSVVVSTWHKAKGLEWPVVILYEMEGKNRKNISLGVRVASDQPAIRLDNPLAGRWIRYWPDPFTPTQSGLTFHARLSATQEETQAVAQARFEELRLLYVGWTRARDILVLAIGKGDLAKKGLSRLGCADIKDLEGPAVTRVTWAGCAFTLTVRSATIHDPAAAAVTPEADYCRAEPRAYGPAVIRPSEESDGSLAEAAERMPAAVPTAGVSIETIGARLPVAGSDDWNLIGDAIHAFFCADRKTMPLEERLSMAAGILARHGVGGRLTGDALIRADDAFIAWVARNWPDAVWHREWPLMHKLADGSLVNGTADCVLEVPGGFVLVDHKSYPGGETRAAEKACAFREQLRLYNQAIYEARGWKMVGAYIHLPVSGLVVKVE